MIIATQCRDLCRDNIMISTVDLIKMYLIRNIVFKVYMNKYDFIWTHSYIENAFIKHLHIVLKQKLNIDTYIIVNEHDYNRRVLDLEIYNFNELIFEGNVLE